LTEFIMKGSKDPYLVIHFDQKYLKALEQLGAGPINSFLIASWVVE